MKNNNSSNKKPKKNGRKIQLPSKAKSKTKLKLKTKETVLPASTYNGGAVFTLDQVNNDTTTASNATTYYAEVDASTQQTQPETVITALPNKEELYSKYTETEEEPSYNNSIVPKANNDGVKTMIIIAGALSLIAFLALILS